MSNKPVVDLNWLCNWLEENSSGIYRPAKEAAHVIRSMSSEIESLRAQLSDKNVSMGVGDGSGSLFVYGNYESIKATQSKIFELEAARKHIAELEAQLKAAREQKPVAYRYKFEINGELQDGFKYKEDPSLIGLPEEALYAAPVPAQQSLAVPDTEYYKVLYDAVDFTKDSEQRNMAIVAADTMLERLKSNGISSIAQQSPAVVVPEDLKEKLQAIVNLIDKPHCETLDSPTEFALSHSKSMRAGNVRSAVVKIIKSLDNQSPNSPQ